MQDLYENLLLSVDTAFLFQIKFYLSIYLHFSQTVQRVCTLVLFAIIDKHMYIYEYHYCTILTVINFDSNI